MSDLQPSLLLPMDQTALAASLRALAMNPEKRSKASCLRDVLDEVEAALAAGAKRADVLAQLDVHGLSMSLATFETTLKRLRAKRGSIQTKPNTSPSCSGAPRPLSPSKAGQAQIGSEPSHDPTELDRIITTQPDLIALAKLAKRKKR